MSGRLFVAADLDEPACEFVADAIERLRESGLDARFTTREKWHATLAFLGDVALERQESVADTIARAAAQSPPFDLCLDAVGAFPSPHRPRVVWIGSSAPQPAFAACARSVRAALEGIGFAFNDDAVVHITVCRIKHPATALPAIALNGSVSVRVDSLTLYRSMPAGRTTTYNVVRKVNLRK